MYTLRTIDKDGLQQNTALGNEYLFADRFMNGGEAFREAFKRVFERDHVADLDSTADDTTKNCVGIVISEGDSIPIWSFQDVYIMTDSGKTFSRLNRLKE